MVDYYKVFVLPDKIATDSLRLARQVYESDARPEASIGIWRGGANVAAYVTGGLRHFGVNALEFSAQGKSYSKEGIGNQTKGIMVNNMEEIVRQLRHEGVKNILAIDDVFDTGRTWHAFHHILNCGLRRSGVPVVTDKENKHNVYEFQMIAEQESYPLRIPLISDIEPLDAAVRIATPYWKPHANRTELKPDFFVETVTIDTAGRWPWIVFPWEAAEDLSKEELEKNYWPFYSALQR